MTSNTSTNRRIPQPHWRTALLLCGLLLAAVGGSEGKPQKQELISRNQKMLHQEQNYEDLKYHRRLSELSVPLEEAVRVYSEKKTVLVTGAAGFVGSHVADFLLKRGDRVIVLDEVNDYYDTSIKESNLKLLQSLAAEDPDQLKIYRGDICNATLLTHIFETDQPTFVCHMAARAGVRPSILDPFVYIHSNIQATMRLFEMAIQYKVVNFVYASSSSVYGGSKSTLFDEHENVDYPISPYAASKRVTELLGMYYHSKFDIPATALRFFTVYGPRGRPDMAPFKFIDWTARGKPIQQFGDGSSSRDYTYIQDIVAGVVGALDRPYHHSYRAVNLGKGSGTSLKDFVQIVSKYVGKKPHIKQLPDQPGDVPYTMANVTRAHEWLNYTATTMFEKGILQTVAWYQQMYPYEKEFETPTTVDESPAAQQQEALRQEREQAEAALVIAKEQRRRLQARRSNHRRLQEVQPMPPHEGVKKVLVVAEEDSTMLTENVVDRLTARGDQVTVLIPDAVHVLDYRFAELEKVHIHQGHLDNSTFLENVLAKEQPKWICYLHAAHNATESINDPYSYVDANIQTFTRLLEVLRIHHSNEIANLVFLTSTSVYNELATNERHAETDLLEDFDSPLSITQKAREIFGHTWHSLYRIPMTALRVPYVYGPSCPGCYVQDGTKELYAPPVNDAAREYMYVSDAVDGIIRALDRPHGYEIVNLGSNDGACQSSASFRDLLGKKLEGRSDIAVQQECQLAAIEKARLLLGFEPRISFSQGVEQVASWYSQHQSFLPALGLEADSIALSTSADHPLSSVAGRADSFVETTPLTEKVTPSRNTDSSGSSDAESAALTDVLLPMPFWIRELAQIQWVLIAVFLMWKIVTYRKRTVPSRRNSPVMN